MNAPRALLTGIVDYAGLFPPAALSMADAVRQYMDYRAGPDAWMLGRFVVPAARLEELMANLPAALPGAPVPVSAVLSGTPEDDVRHVKRFNDRAAARAAVDTLEARVSDPESVQNLARLAPAGMDLFMELPFSADLATLLAAVRASGARAKVRTGGITADAFPSGPEVLRFIRACVDAGVAFKATAGLHHPLRGSYRLTYEEGSPAGVMFGYLNVFLTAVFVREGMADDDALALLEERDPSAFVFGDAGISWRGRTASAEAVARARRDVALSFGACSFREPVDELAALHAVR